MNSNGKTPVVVFSINEQPGKTGLDILQELGIPFKEIEGGVGCYQGVSSATQSSKSCSPTR